MKKTTLGVIVGNRGFFPAILADSGRKEIIKALAAEGIDAVVLGPEDTRFGSVETYEDSVKCAKLFKANADKIDGILITLPNFGEERGIADAIRLSGLNVPVLVHAFADDSSKMTIADRRDSFCGKMSVCNNLRQYGIPFSLTALHCESPDSDDFRGDIAWFAGVCRVVAGLKNVRLGALGARPANFNTVRYSEKLFELAGISVEPLDLSEAFGMVGLLKDDDAEVQTKLAEITGYTKVAGVPPAALVKMAKFGVVLERWMAKNDLKGVAIQCWTSMEEFFGVVPCTIMSMLSNRLIPAACEVDVPGLVGMYALQLAAGRPAALVDWNNNFGDDPDKAVVFHCSNLPKDVFEESSMDYQAIIAGTVGRENTYGTIVGQVKASPFTYCRVSTDDEMGTIKAYAGEGEFTKDALETFGGFGVVEIPELQDLLRYICEEGFEHHVAVTLAEVAPIIEEAFGNYLGWDVYRHS
jgi:L-fucose isomerase-like protein